MNTTLGKRKQDSDENVGCKKKKQDEKKEREVLIKKAATGEEFSIYIQLGHTIRQAKKKIEEKNGVGMDEQHIYLPGDVDTELDDDAQEFGHTLILVSVISTP